MKQGCATRLHSEEQNTHVDAPPTEQCSIQKTRFGKPNHFKADVSNLPPPERRSAWVLRYICFKKSEVTDISVIVDYITWTNLLPQRCSSGSCQCHVTRSDEWVVLTKWAGSSSKRDTKDITVRWSSSDGSGKAPGATGYEAMAAPPPIPAVLFLYQCNLHPVRALNIPSQEPFCPRADICEE